jgi:transcriptional regulator with XRE-family HTH domain/quercetin dioxygenase-like cupin family protein
VPRIGERIRAERVRRGMSVRGLARDIGVSASLISQIETAKSQPSVSTLYAITTALGIPIEDLFGADGAVGAADGSRDRVRAGEPNDQAMAAHAKAIDGAAAPGTPLRVVGPNRHHRVGPVVAPSERDVLTLDSGVIWERLGQVPGVHVDFLRITYQPGGTSSSSGALMRHSGTEFGYVLSGELILSLGFDEHRLGAGDAVSFDSTLPHGYRNDGSEPAVGIWFVLERTD